MMFWLLNNKFTFQELENDEKNMWFSAIAHLQKAPITASSENVANSGSSAYRQKYYYLFKHQSKKSCGWDTKTCQETYNFDLTVKVQGRIWIMNVHDTSSHGDTPMWQIW